MSVVKGKGKRPKKEIILPHLELMAVTIGVHAANFVTRELKIPSLNEQSGQILLVFCTGLELTNYYQC